NRPDRETYEKLRAAAAGNFYDLSEVARTPGDLARLLPVVGRELARKAVASQPPRHLSAAPPLPLPVKGVQSSQAFAAASSGQLLLLACTWTALLAAGICLALITCQSLYTRQSWPFAGDIAKGLLGG